MVDKVSISFHDPLSTYIADLPEAKDMLPI